MKNKIAINMNINHFNTLKLIYKNGTITQREIANLLNISLGKTNSIISDLKTQKFIDNNLQITKNGLDLIGANKPKSAIILAAGYGMRMVPINVETPKGLITVFGEPLIERIIKQLHEVNITNISIVVGFMKEQYEYLIDLYNVNLIVNNEYKLKNNLHSLKKAVNYIDNTYIIPCDIWSKNNPFDDIEIASWYMVTDELSSNSNLRVTNRNEFMIDSKSQGNSIIGISYINNSDSYVLKHNIEKLCSSTNNDNSFWEVALIVGNKMITYPKIVSHNNIYEINTYEQLMEIDNNSNTLQNDAIEVICASMATTPQNIVDIKTLKKGMTNRSFLFSVNSHRFIMRIPGEGTDALINRKEEAEVYNTIKNLNICDDIIYINESNGYKITRYYDNARVCNPLNKDDLSACMNLLRNFHQLKLKVNHEFDLFNKINFYQSLWINNSSQYRDYEKTKANIFKLKNFVNKHCTYKTLTHIDAVPDNFLFIDNDTQVKLIDWEYAAMQDPHVDIAMFCIYALYNKEQIDHLIDIYFENNCSIITRIKIYAYIAICGLLWSNWCEYKSQLGVEFGEYSLKQYRYAKDYFLIVNNELLNLGEHI